MSSTIEKEIDSLVGIGYYETEGGVIADAVRALLEKKPGLRREIAIYLYKNGEVSLWKASEIARMNLEEFKEVLSCRGIKIKVSGTKEESDKRLKEVFNV
jgi:predicted HTH domain antitoxin